MNLNNISMLDRTLIIHGKRGVGKTVLANRIATENGSYISTTVNALMSPFGIGSEIIEKEPKTIVVDDFVVSPKNLGFMKDILEKKYLILYTRGKNPTKVRTPSFIIVTNDEIKSSTSIPSNFVLLKL